MGDKFEIELTDGTKKEATLITRIRQEGTDVDYLYYSVDSEDDNSGNVSIFASKIVNKDGKEVMKNLDNEDERQNAYKIFSETYKKIREQNK